jgi:CRISPR-associated protein Cmr3
MNVLKTTAGEILQITAAIEATPPDSLYEQHINDMSRLHTIGGERRLAEWSVEKTDTAGWSPPPAPGGLCLRMILATPAIFEHGWVPGWIDKKNLEGKIPDTSVEVRLVSAIAQRWLPISGWSYARPYGPKPLRRMVPTGSVYFFEAKRELDSQDWNNMWLSSVCDNPQDKNDGFGAALWGTW